MRRPIRFAYHRPGRGPPIDYDQWLVVDRPDVSVLLQETYDGRDLIVHDELILPAGAPILWFVFPGEWHDVGAFHLADGTLTGWYANICTPVQMEGSSWSSTDLFLDLWTPSKGTPVWLDEDEFADAAEAGVIDPSMAAPAREERSRLEARVLDGSWPPPVVREIDLALARKAVGTRQG